MSITFPAEWAPQQAILLVWPDHHTPWTNQLVAAQQTYLEIIATILPYQQILLLCHNHQASQIVTEQLKKRYDLSAVQLQRLLFTEVQYQDTWIRDYGPITVFNQNQPQLKKFIFNGWGNKFPSSQDNQVVVELYQKNIFTLLMQQATKVNEIDFVLEGGSIDTDGCGTILTTSSCLLTKTRNPSYCPQTIAALFKQHLGCKRILWLHHGSLCGDDTDGHVDMLARFIDQNSICFQACDDPQDPCYSSLTAMQQELTRFKSYTNKPYKLIPLPWPQKTYGNEGQRLPLSYTNFLITNKVILVPCYQVPQDEQALLTLEKCFPKHQIKGIDCLSLIQQNGSLHCCTMQIPQTS